MSTHNTREEKLDIAIANLVFSGLSIAQMEKIPKWLLENVENNKAKFKEAILTTAAQEKEEAVKAAKKEQLERDVRLVRTSGWHVAEKLARKILGGVDVSWYTQQQLDRACSESASEGYQLATKHFRERLDIGQSFEEAVSDMEEALTPPKNISSNETTV